MISWRWRDAGAVERDSLENCCTGNRTGGSNPPLSAIVDAKQTHTLSQDAKINKTRVEIFPLVFSGALGETRTLMSVRTADFESAASTNSATRATENIIYRVVAMLQK